jgi:hypothetical protein
MPMLSFKNFEWSLAAHASDAVDAMFGAFCNVTPRHNSAVRLTAELTVVQDDSRCPPLC